MSDNVFFVLELAVKPGQIDDLRTVMREMVDLTQAEPGTLNYEWFLSDDGANCHIHERYADSEAVLAHGATFPENLYERFLAFQPTRLAVYGRANEAVREAVSAFAPAFLQPLGGFVR
jgi:quinol monooxygenase YgiN